MGKSSVTLFDGTVFDVDRAFPEAYKTVALSMSCGVESAILLPLLIDRYGADNVHVFSAVIHGRRSWEHKRATALAAMCNARYVHSVDRGFQFMTPQENAQLREYASSKVKFDAWFAGGNKLRFSPTFTYTDPSIIERMAAKHIQVPFIHLLKSHTVDLHYKYNNEQMLFASHSCTERGDVHCGECYCCWERVRGFADIGHIDQSTYNVPWGVMLDECYHTDKHFSKNW
jgi:hypothetical protein